MGGHARMVMRVALIATALALGMSHAQAQERDPAASMAGKRRITPADRKAAAQRARAAREAAKKEAAARESRGAKESKPSSDPR